MHKFIFPLLIFISTYVFGHNKFETNNTVQTTKSIAFEDTSKAKEKYTLNPLTSSLLSAFVPGAGQIYNRKYWKAPIVWGGAIALYYGYDAFKRKHSFYHQRQLKI